MKWADLLGEAAGYIREMAMALIAAYFVDPHNATSTCMTVYDRLKRGCIRATIAGKMAYSVLTGRWVLAMAQFGGRLESRSPLEIELRVAERLADLSCQAGLRGACEAAWLLVAHSAARYLKIAVIPVLNHTVSRLGRVGVRLLKNWRMFLTMLATAVAPPGNYVDYLPALPPGDMGIIPNEFVHPNLFVILGFLAGAILATDWCIRFWAQRKPKVDDLRRAVGHS